jgi:hypothetical protein
MCHIRWLMVVTTVMISGAFIENLHDYCIFRDIDVQNVCKLCILHVIVLIIGNDIMVLNFEMVTGLCFNYQLLYRVLLQTFK